MCAADVIPLKKKGAKEEKHGKNPTRNIHLQVLYQMQSLYDDFESAFQIGHVGHSIIFPTFEGDIKKKKKRNKTCNHLKSSIHELENSGSCFLVWKWKEGICYHFFSSQLKDPPIFSIPFFSLKRQRTPSKVLSATCWFEKEREKKIKIKSGIAWVR